MIDNKKVYDFDGIVNRICEKITDNDLKSEIERFRYEALFIEKEINKRALYIQEKAKNHDDDLTKSKLKNIIMLMCENMDLMTRILKLTNDIDFEYELPIQIGKIHTQINNLSNTLNKDEKENNLFFKRLSRYLILIQKEANKK